MAKQTIIASAIDDNAPSTSVSASAVRRPKMCFCDLSIKTKRRRLIEEVKLRSEEELCLVASRKLHSEGNRSAASLVLGISTSLDKAHCIKRKFTGEQFFSFL